MDKGHHCSEDLSLVNERASSSAELIELVKAHLQYLAHYLPSQGPIDVFIHHNTLHSFEDLSFYEALEAAADRYGAQAYLPEGRYKEEFVKGRISRDDLDAVLADEPGDALQIWSNVTLRSLRLEAVIGAPELLLKAPIWWQLAEGGKLDNWECVPGNEVETRALLGRDNHWLGQATNQDVLRTIIERLNSQLPHSKKEITLTQESIGRTPTPSVSELVSRSLRLLWLASLDTVLALPNDHVLQKPKGDGHKPIDVEAEMLVSPFLVKFAASFLDQGIAHWPLQHREDGFFKALVHYLKRATVGRPWWLPVHSSSVVESARQSSPLAWIVSELQRREIEVSTWRSFLWTEAKSIKGWAGMMHLFEQRGDLVPTQVDSHKDSLAGFIAGKLLLERFAVEAIARHQSNAHIKPSDSVDNREGEYRREDWLFHKALHLFFLAQQARISGADLLTFNSQRKQLLLSVLSPTQEQRRKLWQQAYERHFVESFTNAIQAHVVEQGDGRKHQRQAEFQLLFCIDDREESFRRHCEEIEPLVDTYGVVGFFAIDAEYAAHAAAAAVPLCPIVIKPTHRVVEQLTSPVSPMRALFGSSLTSARRGVALGSQRMLGGWLVSLAGIFTMVPLLFRTIAPRWYARWYELLKGSSPESSVSYAEHDADPEAEFHKDVSSLPGFTLNEMVDRVGSLLRTVGLTRDFAPIVCLFGHGSLSHNNPYKSAYDCGACGGRPALINARVFALMANRSDVRQALQLQGLDIPDTTIFVGGFHNTCSDGVEIFDENLIPDSHRRVFERLQEVIFEARGRNALERCRRFPLANVKTPAQALRHVQERTSNIAEPRPEYGHATNAICVVGRRSLTRDLFLDRRAFLVSYDPDGDSDGSLLAGTLAAVIPVCMGINLEYFFSSLDNETYGAGTKLPHNVACLLGIMTGYCSDLRTGLPQQMIEIHEPVRLVTLVDAPRASLESIMSANSTLRRIFLRGWVLLQRFDDDLGVIEMLQEDGTWKLIRSSNDVAHPLISSSMDWMSGTIDNLPFATRLRGQFHFDQATGGTFDLDSKEVR